MFAQNNSDSLLKLKKMLAFVTSIGLIGLSIYFSQLGFGIESSNKMVWIGWFLGFTVTVIELTFNTNVQKLNSTLIATGVIAYVYGMWTNVVGLKSILGDNVLFAIIVGVFVEILPEPLFAWSIGVYDGGDVVGNIGHLFGGSQQRPHVPQNASQMKMGFPEQEDREEEEVPSFNPKIMHRAQQRSHKVVSPIFNNKYTDRFKK